MTIHVHIKYLVHVNMSSEHITALYLVLDVADGPAHRQRATHTRHATWPRSDKLTCTRGIRVGACMGGTPMPMRGRACVRAAAAHGHPILPTTCVPHRGPNKHDMVRRFSCTARLVKSLELALSAAALLPSHLGTVTDPWRPPGAALAMPASPALLMRLASPAMLGLWSRVRGTADPDTHSTALGSHGHVMGK